MFNPLSTGGQRGGHPKDPQLSKSLDALKLLFKSLLSVFDFICIHLENFSKCSRLNRSLVCPGYATLNQYKHRLQLLKQNPLAQPIFQTRTSVF